MRTFYNKLAALSLLGFVLAACGTSNNVVSGHLISKRKVNKGFFINHSKAPKSDDAEAQQVRQPFIQYSEETGVETTPEENVLASTDQAPLMESPTPPASQDALVESSAVEENVNTAPEPVVQGTTAPQAPKIKKDKANKAEFRQAKKELKHAEKRDDVRLLILVIICLFIPPLAVYLHQGSWNETCWINLLLTILFFLPGLIHGLIVILK